MTTKSDEAKSDKAKSVEAKSVEAKSDESGSASNLDPHAAAVRHLTAADPRMAALIARVGPCRMRVPEPAHAADHFVGLVTAIVSQQLSSKAADTIFSRVRALAPGDAFTPRGLLAVPVERLREAGLSGQKAAYVRALCEHVERGDLALDTLHAQDDEAVIEVLTAVKGVGRWTAEMFLMFRLARPDVLPVGDLGVQKGFQRLFGLRQLPKAERIVKLAKPFRPHRTIACWYLWRLTEEKAEPR